VIARERTASAKPPGRADVPPRVERRTLSSQIYAILENGILSGTLRPGTPLSEESLASTYGVSRAPAREAITELERIGLAIRSGPRDRAVAVPTEEMIAHQYEVWWIVDSGRTYLASLEATPDEHAEMRRLIDGMAEGVKRNDPPLYRLNSDRFHEKIRERCRNTLLSHIGYGCDLYIRWFESLYDRDAEPSAECVAEHYEILDAYVRRSLEELTRTIRVHILRQRSRILDAFKVGQEQAMKAGAGRNSTLLRPRRAQGALGDFALPSHEAIPRSGRMSADC
jgi:DNA-binding GntR family transcriptional regulator